LNIIFVTVFGMDVDGVALATVISQCVSAFLIVRRLTGEKSSLRLDVKKLRLHGDSVRGIVSVGLPAGLQSMVSAGSNVLIQSTINSFGAVVVAGNSAASNVGNFVHMGMSAFYQSAISFSGQNCGAGKYRRIWRLLVCVYCCAGAVGLAGGIGAWYFGENLLYLFTDSPEVVAAGMVLMAYQCIPFAICGILDTTIGCIRGMGSSLMTMIITSVGICGFRIAWLAVLKNVPGLQWGIEDVYLSYPVSWLFTLVFQFVLFVYSMKRLTSGEARDS
jgi:Na+-driven multidrug efflux pump